MTSPTLSPWMKWVLELVPAQWEHARFHPYNLTCKALVRRGLVEFREWHVCGGERHAGLWQWRRCPAKAPR